MYACHIRYILLRLFISYEYYTNVYALALLDCIFRRLHADVSSNTSRLFVRASNYTQKDEATLLILLTCVFIFSSRRYFIKIPSRLIIILLRATIIKLHNYDIFFLLRFLYSNEELFLYFYFINRSGCLIFAKHRITMRVNKITECRYYLGKWVSAESREYPNRITEIANN